MNEVTQHRDDGVRLQAVLLVLLLSAHLCGTFIFLVVDLLFGSVTMTMVVVIVRLLEYRMSNALDQEKTQDADNDEHVSLHTIVAVAMMIVLVVVVMMIFSTRMFMYMRLMRVTTMTVAAFTHVRQRVEEHVSEQAAYCKRNHILRQLLSPLLVSHERLVHAVD